MKKWFLTDYFQFWVPRKFLIFIFFQLHTKCIQIQVHVALCEV